MAGLNDEIYRNRHWEEYLRRRQLSGYVLTLRHESSIEKDWITFVAAP
jgi:hypothetical protein